MKSAVCGIVGASGYSGLELTRLLARHPRVSLAFATSDRWVGQRVAARVDVAPESLTYVSNDDALARAGECAAVFLATPAEVSLELVPKLLAAGTKVIDLAGSFRLRDAAQYPLSYRFTHPAPALLADAAYGLPELFRSRVAGARLVANPGCYATAAILSVAPLLKAGLVEPSSVIVSAASGVSGAGRKATEEYNFMEIDSDVRAYRVLSHQHTPEIDQALSSFSGHSVKVAFVPHLLPIKRGIISTTFATLSSGAGAAEVGRALADAYGREPLVRLCPSADAVRIADVARTPRCHLGFAVEGRRLVVITALDNLLKGAASQAVQNLNVVMGFGETEGLVA